MGLNNKFKYVFGPVPSRRLGFSLGVDLVPFKTCSYDCIYCQLGRTKVKTISRKEYVPLDKVIEEINEKLKQDIHLDYITLSGSGEPTLYSRIRELIIEIKNKTKKPIAVLTNGSLLWDKRVQNDLMEADLVIPSLDAGDEDIFRYVNRTHLSLSLEKVSDGIADFCRRFSKNVWLEVFLLNGVTTVSFEVGKIVTHIRKIKPNKVQLNTIARPPAEFFALSVPKEQMDDLAKLFGNSVEIISDFNKSNDKVNLKISKEEILNLIKRRPCDLEDISQGLSIHRNEALKYIEQLLKEDKITSSLENNSFYYIKN